MGEIVLLLKLNGRTDFPSDANAISPLQATGEDAIQFGMPLIVWSHPRGETVDSKCGTDFFYAIDYGARVASEVGTDVVKLTFPHPEKRTNVKAEYDKDFPTQEAIA